MKAETFELIHYENGLLKKLGGEMMNRLKSISISACLTCLICTLGFTQVAPGYHGGQSVWVNGVGLSSVQINQLEQLHGAPIPNGRYWLDFNTGVWGYEGGPPQGHLGDGYKNNGNTGSYYKRTPFGDVGGDGNSSYWFDRDTGCSVVDGEASC